MRPKLFKFDCFGASQEFYRNLWYIKSPLSEEICLLFGRFFISALTAQKNIQAVNYKLMSNKQTVVMYWSHLFEKKSVANVYLMFVLIIWRLVWGIWRHCIISNWFILFKNSVYLYTFVTLLVNAYLCGLKFLKEVVDNTLELNFFNKKSFYKKMDWKKIITKKRDCATLYLPLSQYLNMKAYHWKPQSVEPNFGQFKIPFNPQVHKNFLSVFPLVSSAFLYTAKTIKFWVRKKIILRER